MHITHAMNGKFYRGVNFGFIHLIGRLFFADINSSKACEHGWSCQIMKEDFRSNIQSAVAMFKKEAHNFIHAFYTWCVFPKRKIQCQQTLISSQIHQQYILRIPKELLTSNNPKLRGLVVAASHFEWRHCGVAPWRGVTAKVSWQSVLFGIQASFTNVKFN